MVIQYYLNFLQQERSILTKNCATKYKYKKKCSLQSSSQNHKFYLRGNVYASTIRLLLYSKHNDANP